MVNNNNFLDNNLKQGVIVVPKLPTADDLVTKPIFHKEAGKKGFFDSETFMNSFVAHTKWTNR